MNDIFESIFVEVETISRNLIIGCNYRPPNSNLTIFNKEIDLFFRELNATEKDVYIMGDYNINLLNCTSHSNTSDFVDVMFSSSFLPLINRPTRISKTSATLIDNIITNCHDDLGEHLSGILPTDISDHFTLFHLISSNRLFNENHGHLMQKRIINNKTILHLKNRVQHCDWNSVLHCQNANTAYNNFYDIFKKQYNECIPLNKFKSRGNTPKKPWISQSLLNCIKKKE